MSYFSAKVISFDATGTLFDPNPSLGATYSEVLEQFDIHIPDTELEMKFMMSFHKYPLVPTEELNEKTAKHRWQLITRDMLPDEYTNEIFDVLWTEFGKGIRWMRKPKIRATLTRLKEQGYKLIVLSNWDKRLYRILEELDLLHFMDHVFISTELGMEKTNRGVFEKVASAISEKPENILHIGNDKNSDYKMAIEAEWQALLFLNRIPHDMDPHHMLGSIDQLPELLKATCNSV